MKWFTLLLVLFVAGPCFADEMYSWEDENGVHFTDNTANIPKSKNVQKRPGLGKTVKPTGPKKDLSQQQINAIFEDCKAAISYTLKAPATARYEIYNPSKPVFWSEDAYKMMLKVDAQNSYGALIRDNRVCVLDDNNNVINTY